MGAAGADDSGAVQGGQSDPAQVLPVAPGLDQFARMPPAADLGVAGIGPGTRPLAGTVPLAAPARRRSLIPVWDKHRFALPPEARSP